MDGPLANQDGEHNAIHSMFEKKEKENLQNSQVVKSESCWVRCIVKSTIWYFASSELVGLNGCISNTIPSKVDSRIHIILIFNHVKVKGQVLRKER